MATNLKNQEFIPLHYLYIVQYDDTVSFMTLYLLQWKEEGVDTGA